MLCRGLTEEDFVQVATFFDRAINITLDIKSNTGSKLKDFKAALEHGPDAFPELVALRKEVQDYAQKFPSIGY